VCPSKVRQWKAITMATRLSTAKTAAPHRVRGLLPRFNGMNNDAHSQGILDMGISCLFRVPACSRSNVQFLPEIDAHLKLNSAFRTYLEAKDDRGGGEPTQFAIGPSIQLYLKPLIKLKHVRADLDDSKSRALVLETGYRHITTPDAPPDNRMLTVATLNFPLSLRLARYRAKLSRMLKDK